MELKEIFEELKKQGIEVIKDAEQGTFTRFRLIGPGYDSTQTWIWWQIKEAYKRGRLYSREKESEGLKKFDKRIRPGTKILLNGYGVGWRIVKSVHPSRKWVEVEGYLGNFPREHVAKFSNNR